MAGGTVNKVILIGNLGKDPEIRSTQDGREIANITIATSESWTDKNSGERREKTEWHKVAIFNPGLVGLCKKYLHKGSKVFIEGQLQTRKWQDATSGQDRYITEVVIQGYNGALTFLDSNKSGGASGGYNDNSGSGSNYSSNKTSNSGGNDNASSADYINELDDEIPF